MFELAQERPTLVEWVNQKGADGVWKYQLPNDRTSIYSQTAIDRPRLASFTIQFFTS